MKQADIPQFKPMWHVCPYLCLKAFNQDGHQQVEEDIVSKGHEGHKVESGNW